MRNEKLDLVPDFIVALVEKSTLGKDKRIAYLRIKAKDLFDDKPVTLFVFVKSSSSVHFLSVFSDDAE